MNCHFLPAIKPTIISAQGRCFDVEVLYKEQIDKEIFPENHGENIYPQKPTFSTLIDDPQWENGQVRLALEILRHLDESEKFEPSGKLKSVMIFLPGLNEIKEVEQNILQNLDRRPMNAHNWHGRYIIHKLHSSIPRDRESTSQLLREPPRGRRKIILSTNVAESSITIGDVEHIIDFCLTKYLEKDTATNLSQLKLKWASRDMCKQRQGRVGRTRPGKCWRLVSRDFFKNEMLEAIPPEIERCPLDKCVLLGKSIFPDLTPRKFLESACAKPKDIDIQQAIKVLKEIGALTMHSEKKNVDMEGKVLKTFQLLEFY